MMETYFDDGGKADKGLSILGVGASDVGSARSTVEQNVIDAGKEGLGVVWVAVNIADRGDSMKVLDGHFHSDMLCLATITVPIRFYLYKEFGLGKCCKPGQAFG